MKIQASVRTAMVGAIAAAAILLAGCGTPTDDTVSGPADGGSFSFAIAEPEALAPTASCYETECSYVMRNVFTGLAQADSDGDGLKMMQAESVTTEDSQHWTINLKKGWKFHNGEPVDADAYIRAWNYGAYGPNAARANFFFATIVGYDEMNTEKPTAETLTGLKKVDDYQFTIDLKAPFSQWPSVMSGLTFLPMAQACVDDIRACNEHPIGNGPYELDGDWQHNQSITLKRWDDYAGPNKGHAQTITLKIYPKKGAALQDLLAGQVDIIRPNPDQVGAADGQSNIKIIDDPSSSMTRLTFPFGESAYTLKVRQAISMSIDREAITKSILSTSDPADDIMPPVVPGYEAGACESCVFNPDKAKQLLAEDGGWKGTTMNIWIPADQGYDQMMEAIGNQVKKNLGIDYTINALPQAQYFQKKEYDGPNLGTWSMDYLSPENYLRPQFSNAGLQRKHRWENADFEKLLVEADTAPDAQEAQDLYRQAADIVLGQIPSAPLFFGKAYLFYNGDSVTGLKYDGPNEILPLTAIKVKQ